MWAGVSADPCSKTSTPSSLSTKTEADKLEELLRKHEPDNLQWKGHILNNLARLQQREWAETHYSHLFIDLPVFDFPVVFNEPQYAKRSLRSIHTICNIFDSELGLENPVESQHRKLLRSHRTGPLDREIVLLIYSRNQTPRSEMNWVQSCSILPRRSYPKQKWILFGSSATI